MSRATDYTVPLSKAAVRRSGQDLSVITYGAMVHVALEAAETLVQEDIDTEVVDLRTLMPLDREAVLATAKKTGKVILLHEDTLTGGLGGELAGNYQRARFRTSRRTPRPHRPSRYAGPL